MDTFNIVIVGHVDHGKSTLIGRLLVDTRSLPADQLEALARRAGGRIDDIPFAYILDHLEEERARNITIDTAQTFFSTASRQYVIIDAPGHKEFVKNMITGASQADAAVLVVAANEGVKEQTRRHAALLSLLDVRQVVVAINKMDLVAWSRKIYGFIVKQLGELFDSLKLSARQFVPLSAMKGEGMLQPSSQSPWYTGGGLLQELDLLVKPVRAEGMLAMPVQDVYDIDGRRVVVGRIEAGRLGVGQAISIQPDGQAATVKEIRLMDSSPAEARAGQCIGLVLNNGVAVRRGQVIVGEGSPLPTGRRITARAFWLADQPLRRDQAMMLCLTTQAIPCRVRAIRNRIDSATMQVLAEQSDELAFTEVADLEIELDQVLVADQFERLAELGRFTLNADEYPCGGGIVLSVAN